jgi:hypothetical protein
LSIKDGSKTRNTGGADAGDAGVWLNVGSATRKTRSRREDRRIAETGRDMAQLYQISVERAARM